ncbi:hypothetical protein CPB84DRAFT_1766621 [Gymnopilus junonius]|uniref:Uncharacterized protein n=1 Tax=Gymnopilus junonius TaxID=109634 RepID=A0A9P5TT70_GYMJU|nr:hypothetical protein CPB84DRAFT_1766621 [Gymnopilus junonius]
MSTSKLSFTTSAVKVFTRMANTPLVEPDSWRRPNEIPLQTFSSTSGPSFDSYWEFSNVHSSPSSPRHSRNFSLSSLDNVSYITEH